MHFRPDAIDVKYRDTKLNVPYFSQYLDVTDCGQQNRACGMVCVYTVLKYFDVKSGSLDELIAKGIDEGGYGSSGWLHEYLVKVFVSYGCQCERRERMLDTDTELFQKAILKDSPVIVSVERVLFDRRDFHMLVLTGIRECEAGKLEGFYYHDPAGLSRISHRYVPIQTFYLSWRRMAILPTRT